MARSLEVPMATLQIPSLTGQSLRILSTRGMLSALWGPAQILSSLEPGRLLAVRTPWRLAIQPYPQRHRRPLLEMAQLLLETMEPLWATALLPPGSHQLELGRWLIQPGAIP